MAGVLSVLDMAGRSDTPLPRHRPGTGIVSGTLSRWPARAAWRACQLARPLSATGSPEMLKAVTPGCREMIAQHRLAGIHSLSSRGTWLSRSCALTSALEAFCIPASRPGLQLRPKLQRLLAPQSGPSTLRAAAKCTPWLICQAYPQRPVGTCCGWQADQLVKCLQTCCI